jgi:Glycosyl hydrolase family 20, catalytic domain
VPCPVWRELPVGALVSAILTHQGGSLACHNLPMLRRDFLKLSSMATTIALTRSASATQASGNRLRGIMIDAARLTERPEYYRRVIDFCRDWKLNAILFRLTDDQGSAFRFESHPELVTHDHALTASQARDLAEYGQKRGVQLIPEIESFGHTSYITAVPKYQHLADTPLNKPTEFVGISPVHPHSLSLMRDLYREVSQAFPSQYLHAGCDEVNWGGSDLSQKALEKKSRAEIWADYLNGLDSTAHQLGKELIVWGDFVAHKEPEILRHLDKRVIVMDWQYYVTEPQPLLDTAKQVASAGLRVIGAPALITCQWGPRPGAQSLANVDAFAHAYSSENDSRFLGVIVANWTPTRFLANSLWDSFAYAATSLTDGPDAARRLAFPQFVERFYGAKWNDSWRSVFADFYRITPGRDCAPDWVTLRLPLPSASDDDVKQALAAPVLDPEPYRQSADAIRKLVPSVKRNPADFDSFSLSADYLAHITWREQQWRGKPDFAEIAKRDAAILRKLEIDWNVARFDDSTGKTKPYPFLTPYDQLLLRMRQATGYSKTKA